MPNLSRLAFDSLLSPKQLILSRFEFGSVALLKLSDCLVSQFPLVLSEAGKKVGLGFIEVANELGRLGTIEF